MWAAGVAQQPSASKQSEIDRYSAVAQQALAVKDWTTAVNALRRLEELAPNVAEVHGDLGMAYYSEGRVAEAAQSFQRALGLNPSMTNARVMLGICFAELGRFHAASSILEPAFHGQFDPPTARLIGISLQRSYAGLKQHAKAAAIAEQLLERYPNDPELLFEASRLYADRAYDTMSALIRTSPDSVWTHYARAEVDESLQRHDLAIAEYRKVLTLEPRLPGVHLRIGRAILRSAVDPRARNEALSEFEQELAIAPDNADAEYELGEIFRERGDFEQALKHFSTAIDYRGEFEEARIGLARTLLSLDRPREALPDLLEVVRLDSGNGTAHFLLASAYKRLGDTRHYHEQLNLFEALRRTSNSTEEKLPTAASKPTQQALEPSIPRP